MIDFDSLVLSPVQDIFARPIIVTPLQSQPGAPPYNARGVWSAKPADVLLEDGSVLNSQDLTLGIRKSEFAVMIEQGDTIEIPAAGPYPRVGICAIDKFNVDGQGGVELVLKIVEP